MSMNGFARAFKSMGTPFKLQAASVHDRWGTHRTDNREMSRHAGNATCHKILDWIWTSIRTSIAYEILPDQSIPKAQGRLIAKLLREGGFYLAPERPLPTPQFAHKSHCIPRSSSRRH
eukprot:SAG11_NODE_1278_length_5317_cov_4.188386_4_plen_118_part_00